MTASRASALLRNVSAVPVEQQHRSSDVDERRTHRRRLCVEKPEYNAPRRTRSDKKKTIYPSLYIAENSSADEPHATERMRPALDLALVQPMRLLNSITRGERDAAAAAADL